MRNHTIKYYLFIFLLLATTLTACGTYDTSPNKTSQSDTDKSPKLNYTAVSFSLTIDDNAGESQTDIPSPLAGEGQGGGDSSARTLAKLDCTASSIATIEIAVYDSTGNELVKKSFNCNAHSGNIEVPSGNNRKFVFSGKNSSGVEVYRGEQNSVNLQSGIPVNIGEVKLETLYLLPPIGLTAIAGDGQNTISWTTVTGATAYNIYWSTTTGVTKTTGTKISNVKSPYLHTGLTNGTTYRYVVTAVNSYGESGESDQASAKYTSVITLDTTAPANTTGTNFINSGASVSNSTSVTLSISATDSIGVTGYYASENSTTPSASDAGWKSISSTTTYSAGVTFTLSNGDGAKTVYVWFKDAVGNVSSVVSDSITYIGVSNDNAKALTIQEDGKIVVAGYTYSERVGLKDFALTRYSTDGSLDVTFGNNGMVTAGINSMDGVKSMAVQSDGKILVVGSSAYGGYYDFVLLRFNANGSLDATFGKTGKVITDFSVVDEATALTIQSDGKIVIAGRSVNGGTNDFALVRYNIDGSLDTAFGVGGKATTDFGGTENDTATAIGLQFDGKIVVAGYSSNSRTYDFAIARYRADGTLDTTFGNGGKVTTAIGISHDYARAISIQPDGKIVIAGETFDLYPGGSMNFALARFNPDGSLDATFGTDGKTTTDFGTTDDYANTLAIQSDGRIVIAGYSTVRNSSVTNFVLARYNPDGSLDPVFGEAGKMTIDFSGSAVANALAIQTDSRIVVVGMAVDPYNSFNEDFALVRINPDSSLDTTFGGDGKVTTSIP